MLAKACLSAALLIAATVAKPEVDAGSNGFDWFHLPLTGEALVNDADHISRLNSVGGMTWKAGHNSFFDGKTFNDARELLGTVAPTPDQIHPTLADIMYEAIKTVDIPAEFDSHTQWPGLIHPIRNQQQCGSCWAVSASEVLSDRFAIASKKASPVLSPEDLVSCDTADNGCRGGQLPAAWTYMKNTGLVTDTCFPYTAGNGTAPSCRTKCVGLFPAPFTRSKASSAYSIQGVENMQKDIMTHGPIQVAFMVYKSFMSYQSGVYSKHWYELIPEGGHAVKIVGWGTESGTDYWLVANSWDTTWGLDGFFKIKRGNNACGIEQMGPPYAGLPATNKDSTVVV